MAEDNKNFLTSLPGILTGIAAVIGAVTTLLVALNSNKPNQPAVAPSNKPPAQQADPATNRTTPATQQPGAETATSPSRQSAESSQNTVTQTIRPVRIAGERLALQPHVLQTLRAFNLTAVIDDPDGYTNVRSMKSSSSQIVATIKKNEQFYTYHQNENWWQVKTAQGKIGYVHVSRIKVLPTP
jgi:gas vesicle protein